MGKQRYWSGNGRAATATATASTRRLKNEPYHEEASSTSAGCMCAVFQLFDFHPLNQHHHPPQSPVSLNPIISPPLDDPISTGTEAPRNSLESDEEPPLSCSTKQKEDGLHIPKSMVEIKTRKEYSSNEDGGNSKECVSGNSPTTKTPTLVARLMGLDLLPQSNSPSTTPRTTASASPIYPLVQKPKSRECSAQENYIIGSSRSLPETPRTSCERKSNMENNNYHHRLSLQIPNYEKENASPSHYAKEIVKQIKESVSRSKDGLNDITNYTRRDQEVLMVQTKPSKKVSSLSSSSSASVSPRLRLRVLEAKNGNKPTPKVEGIKDLGVKAKAKAKTKIKTPSKKGIKEEEAFVVPSRKTKGGGIDSPLKKSKKTPLSNQLLSFSSVPTVVMKKDPPFSSPKPSPPQSGCSGNGGEERGEKESKGLLLLEKQLKSCSNFHTHHQHVIIQFQPPNNKHHITTADCRKNDDITAEVEYVRQILRRTCSSPPYSSVFLENSSEEEEEEEEEEVTGVCHKKSHAKLLSHLVQELLRRYEEVTPGRLTAAEVVEKVCEKVRRFPRAKCEVLEDIDGIIEKDMLDRFEEQHGDVIMVEEIEEWILDELLTQTLRFLLQHHQNDDLAHGVV